MPSEFLLLGQISCSNIIQSQHTITRPSQKLSHFCLISSMLYWYTKNIVVWSWATSTFCWFMSWHTNSRFCDCLLSVKAATMVTHGQRFIMSWTSEVYFVFLPEATLATMHTNSRISLPAHSRSPTMVQKRFSMNQKEITSYNIIMMTALLHCPITKTERGVKEMVWWIP